MTYLSKSDSRVRRWSSWIVVALMMTYIIYQGGEFKKHQAAELLARQAEQEAKLRAELIVMSSSFAIIMCDEAGTITVANLAAAELLGWDRASLLGQSSEVLVPRDQRESHRRGMARSARDIREYAGDYLVTMSAVPLTALRKDGSTVDVDARIRVIKYGGKVEFIISMKEREADDIPIEPVKPVEPAPLILPDDVLRGTAYARD